MGVDRRDEWIEKLDMENFKEEVSTLGKRLRSEEGEADRAHLGRLVGFCDLLLVVGLAGCGLSPSYVFPWACLGIAITLRWCAVAHHVSHGGYNRCAEAGYKRGTFGVGGLFYRMRDWLDWMLPEAWDVEHNTMHHYATNEKDDPDFVQRNFDPVRELEIPTWLKVALMPFGIMVWKWMYYASNTWKHLRLETARRNGQKMKPAVVDRAVHPLLLYQVFAGAEETELAQPVEMFFRVFAPYLFFRLVLPPLVFYFVGGAEECSNAIFNVLLAEIWANVHSFAIIVPNHAGDDLYWFDSHVKPNTGTYFLRQIIGSANYHTGSNPSYPGWVNDVIDGMQGWLNYQIEHHCYPNLSMLSYRKAQPELKKICLKYGVPYVQEPLWTRVRKTVEVAVGLSSNRLFPRELEVQADLGTFASVSTE
ncbi:NADPH-dependent stearoyl-CoA 9-desaturase [Diplonema papillatum]|nr:NADPH-dependent stearoyl-CoA 9-desaturase [Diplonema papillatum]